MFLYKLSLMLRQILCFLLIFCALPALAIFNLRNNIESMPNLSQKKWISMSQGCHSCDELLKELETFCSGKKPSPKQLGFLIAGSHLQEITKKLNNYSASYERFVGSPSEFYSQFQIRGSPTLKTDKLLILGKTAILKALKKSPDFCLGS